MCMPTLARDDYDGSIHAQVDRARAANLGDVGLPATGWRSLVDRAGEEHFVQLRFNMGPADYWPDDWSHVARDARDARDPPCAPAMTRSCRGAGTAGAPLNWSARSASGSGRRPTRDRQRHRGDDRPPVEADPRCRRARRPRRQRHRPGTSRRRGDRIGGAGGGRSVKQSVDCYCLLYDGA